MEKLDRVRFLVIALNAYTKDYEQGNPKITDEEWDNMYFELKSLEEETGLILSNSPTQTITYDVVNALSKVEHSHKMLSLEKTKSLDELNSFIGKKAEGRRFVGGSRVPGRFVCSRRYPGKRPCGRGYTT